jgi:ribonuclease VapC
MYIVEREKGINEVEHTANIIDQLAVEIIPVDRPLVFAAARLKARYPISYADASAAAVAKRYGGRVMTGDPEFKAVEPEVAIHWLPGRRR